MSFQIHGLAPEKFAPFFALSADELKAVGGVYMIAKGDSGFPCRVCLEDAKPDEKVILIHYEHQSADTPYRASAAIFIRQNATQATLDKNEVPEQFRTRIISGRAFDEKGMMVDADVCDGKNLESMIEQLLGLPSVSYLQLHYAKHGCFAARVEPAQ